MAICSMPVQVARLRPLPMATIGQRACVACDHASDVAVPTRTLRVVMTAGGMEAEAAL